MKFILMLAFCLSNALLAASLLFRWGALYLLARRHAPEINRPGTAPKPRRVTPWTHAVWREHRPATTA
ncbi:MAG TPA: hypothetical protein VF507_00650 [Pyrinomonadaceae bacterium]